MTAIPSLTIGTSWLGFPDTEADENTSPLAVASAILDSPHTLIDTSNEYMAGGSETTLGLAFASRPSTPHQVVTKADADPETRVFDRDRVWKSFEESAVRLGIDHFPVYHLHDPYTVTFDEAMGRDGAVAGMLELKEQGLVGAIGIAAGRHELVLDYVLTDVFDALLTHNRFTLVNREAEALLNAAADRHMTVFNAAPFGGGILAGSGTTYGYRAAPPELVRWLDRTSGLCDDFGVSMGAAALQFSMREPRIHSTVVGISKLSRLRELSDLESAAIPEEFWISVAAMGTPPSSLPA